MAAKKRKRETIMMDITELCDMVDPGAIMLLGSVFAPFALFRGQ
jgi:hypothetical protein